MGGNQTLPYVRTGENSREVFTLQVCGHFENCDDSLSIQLSNRKHPEKAAVCLNIVPNESLIIYKFIHDEVWIEEKLKLKNEIPFSLDNKYKFKIYKNHQKIKIIVNGTKICNFKYRKFAKNLNYLEATGDFIVLQVNLEIEDMNQEIPLFD